MIIRFKIFENTELKGKIIAVNYKLIHFDINDNPTTLVTDYKIEEVKDNSVVIIAKGYEYVFLSKYGWYGDYSVRNKKGWIAFDDLNRERKITREYPKKDIQDGNKKIKVYDFGTKPLK